MTAQNKPASDLRELFLLRPDVVFLNHGSFGACPLPVFEAYQQWQLELERQPVEFLGRRLWLLREAREALGRRRRPGGRPGLRAQRDHGLERRRPLPGPEPGDEVLASNHEHGALIAPGALSVPRRGPPTSIAVAAAHRVGGRGDRAPVGRRHGAHPGAVREPHHLSHGIDPARAGVGAPRAGSGHHHHRRRRPRAGQIPLDLEALGLTSMLAIATSGCARPRARPFIRPRNAAPVGAAGRELGLGAGADDAALPHGGDLAVHPAAGGQGTRDIAAYLRCRRPSGSRPSTTAPRVRQECHELVRYARRPSAS